LKKVDCSKTVVEIACRRPQSCRPLSEFLQNARGVSISPLVNGNSLEICFGDVRSPQMLEFANCVTTVFVDSL